MLLQVSRACQELEEKMKMKLLIYFSKIGILFDQIPCLSKKFSTTYKCGLYMMSFSYYSSLVLGA